MWLAQGLIEHFITLLLSFQGCLILMWTQLWVKDVKMRTIWRINSSRPLLGFLTELGSELKSSRTFYIGKVTKEKQTHLKDVFTYPQANLLMAQPLWKTVWQFLKKLTVNLAYGPVIPPPDVYPREMKICPHNNLHTNVHTTLFIIVKEENNPNVHQLVNG